MDRLFMLFGDFGDRSGGGDTWIDRLNCKYTVYVLVFFSLLVTTRHFVDEPIACWADSHLTSAQVEFVNKVCWTKDTYYLAISETRIPKREELKEYISYYQWIGLFLVLQAIFFYLPRPLWHLLSKKSGIAVSTITDAALHCQRQTDPEGRDKTIRYIVKHMGRFLMELSRSHLMSNRVKGIWWVFYSNYLICAYLFIKMIYLVNIILQFLWLNNFLGGGYVQYGWEVFQKMIVGQRWRHPDKFPRVTLCDVPVRKMGNIQNYTIQCALPLNLVNESVFIFIWMWFFMLLVATTGSMIMWLVEAIFDKQSFKYIKTRLIAFNELGDEQHKQVEYFVKNYLRGDGMFLIQMLSRNSSDIIAAEVICGLWNHYLENRRAIERLESVVDNRKQNGNKQLTTQLVQDLNDIT